MKCRSFILIICALLLSLSACSSHSDDFPQEEVSNQSGLDNSAEDYHNGIDDNGEDAVVVDRASISLCKTVDTDSGGLVVKNDNSLWVWGKNRCGELGNGTKEEIYVPEKVMEGVKSVVSNGSAGSTLILKIDGSLWGCGYAGCGILAEETINQSAVSVPVHIMDDVLDIENDGGTYYVIKSDNSLWGWGSDSWGILGNEPTGVAQAQFTPVKIFDDVAQICSDGWRLFIIKTDNSLWYCGNDSYGYREQPIVNGHTVSECIMTPKKLMDDVKGVSADCGTVYYVTMDGVLYGWGCSPFYSNEPTYLADNVAAVKAGKSGVDGCNFIKIDGTLWNWSGSLYYYTNDGRRERWDESELINPIIDVVSICNGSYFPDFVKADGSLWAQKGGASQLVEDYSALPAKVMDSIKIE